MNGRQSGAVHYLASLSLYYYSPGFLRRSVSSLVVPRSFFLSLVLLYLIVSLFLCFLFVPFQVVLLFSFAGLTVKRPGSLHFVSFASTGYLTRLQEIRFAVPVTGHHAQPVPYTDSRCGFCIHRIHGSPGSSRSLFR